MHTKLNFQYLFSYLGLIPFFIIIIDKYFFFQIKQEIIIDFIIYYTVLIFVFIGSTNWNFENNVKNYFVIYGFLPSLFGVIIIILNLYDFDQLNLALILIFFLLLQLIFDYFFLYYSRINKNPFYFLRLPLTLIIVTFIGIIIF